MERRERLYGDVIDEASKCFADAIAHQMHEPSALVRLYAVINRMRLFASRPIIDSAEQVMARIAETYQAPNVEFGTIDKARSEQMDVLRTFSEACRDELT